MLSPTSAHIIILHHFTAKVKKKTLDLVSRILFLFYNITLVGVFVIA